MVLHFRSSHIASLLSFIFGTVLACHCSCDIPFRAQMIRDYLASGQTPSSTKEPIKTLAQSLHRAVHFYSMLQTESGHWSGDYGGPLFLLPGLIVVWYVMGQPALMWSAAETTLMKQYITVHQQMDGGWGTHST